MTLGTLTPDDLRLYSRIDPDPDEEGLICGILAASRSYCLSHTGLSEMEAEEYPDLALAALVVAADLYDTRSMTVQEDKVNPVVSAILGAHARNLL